MGRLASLDPSSSSSRGFQGSKRQSQEVKKSEAFAFGDFISFDKRQKKRKQRKTLPRTELTRRFVDAGIFLIGILPHRKSPHIHVRRPPGLQIPILRVAFHEGQSQSQRKRNGNGNGSGNGSGNGNGNPDKAPSCAPRTPARGPPGPSAGRRRRMTP
jgi:hypothetical protein